MHGPSRVAYSSEQADNKLDNARTDARSNHVIVRPCYGPLFPARAKRAPPSAKEKGDHNMGARDRDILSDAVRPSFGGCARRTNTAQSVRQGRPFKLF